MTTSGAPRGVRTQRSLQSDDPQSVPSPRVPGRDTTPGTPDNGQTTTFHSGSVCSLAALLSSALLQFSQDWRRFTNTLELPLSTVNYDDAFCSAGASFNPVASVVPQQQRAANTFTRSLQHATTITCAPTVPPPESRSLSSPTEVGSFQRQRQQQFHQDSPSLGLPTDRISENDEGIVKFAMVTGSTFANSFTAAVLTAAIREAPEAAGAARVDADGADQTQSTALHSPSERHGSFHVTLTPECQPMLTSTSMTFETVTQLRAHLTNALKIVDAFVTSVVPITTALMTQLGVSFDSPQAAVLREGLQAMNLCHDDAPGSKCDATQEVHSAPSIWNHNNEVDSLRLRNPIVSYQGGDSLSFCSQALKAAAVVDEKNTLDPTGDSLRRLDEGERSLIRVSSPTQCKSVDHSGNSCCHSMPPANHVIASASTFPSDLPLLHHNPSSSTTAAQLQVIGRVPSDSDPQHQPFNSSQLSLLALARSGSDTDPPQCETLFHDASGFGGQALPLRAAGANSSTVKAAGRMPRTSADYHAARFGIWGGGLMEASQLGTSAMSMMHAPQLVMTSKLLRGEDDVGMKMLNDYVMLQTLGEGACGKVKLAYSVERGMNVAIKIVRRRRGMGGEGARVEALRQEIAVMKKLRHKNIVSLYEVIDDPEAEKMYLVMQYIDRGSIGNCSDKSEGDAEGACNGDAPGPATCTTVAPGELAAYARQVTAGLDYLHSHGVAHRDLKPENILVNSDGQVFLADFSVASAAADGGGAGGFAGTPLFMAPEVACSASTLDEDALAAADIWSLGVTLYALLQGQLLFADVETIRSLWEWRTTTNSTKDVSTTQHPRHVATTALEVLKVALGAIDAPEWRSLLSAMLQPDSSRRPTAGACRALIKNSLLLSKQTNQNAASLRTSASKTRFHDDASLDCSKYFTKSNLAKAACLLEVSMADVDRAFSCTKKKTSFGFAYSCRDAMGIRAKTDDTQLQPPPRLTSPHGNCAELLTNNSGNNHSFDASSIHGGTVSLFTTASSPRNSAAVPSFSPKPPFGTAPANTSSGIRTHDACEAK